MWIIGGHFDRPCLNAKAEIPRSDPAVIYINKSVQTNKSYMESVIARDKARRGEVEEPEDHQPSEYSEISDMEPRTNASDYSVMPS